MWCVGGLGSPDIAATGRVVEDTTTYGLSPGQIESPLSLPLKEEEGEGGGGWMLEWPADTLSRQERLAAAATI